eukprot:scaffold32280_cov133-Isochrysis_galbana.AAC.2
MWQGTGTCTGGTQYASAYTQTHDTGSCDGARSNARLSVRLASWRAGEPIHLPCNHKAKEIPSKYRPAISSAGKVCPALPSLGASRAALAACCSPGRSECQKHTDPSPGVHTRVASIRATSRRRARRRRVGRPDRHAGRPLDSLGTPRRWCRGLACRRARLGKRRRTCCRFAIDRWLHGTWRCRGVRPCIERGSRPSSCACDGRRRTGTAPPPLRTRRWSMGRM